MVLISAQRISTVSVVSVGPQCGQTAHANNWHAGHNIDKRCAARREGDVDALFIDCRRAARHHSTGGCGTECVVMGMRSACA